MKMKRKKQRGVEKDIEAFCGWRFLLDLVDVAPNVFLKGLISGLFLTGCRVSELIELKKSQLNMKVSVAPEKLYDYSRVRIYQFVQYVGRLLDKDVPFSHIHSSQLYPHWFRAQRARQLRHDYKFTDEELRDWFGWKYAKTKERMPSVYGKSSWVELAEKMGVEIGYY